MAYDTCMYGWPGLKILSVYMSGSKNMSYDSASLTTPDIKWLGVRPSDLDRYNIPQQCRLSMTESDLKTGRELLKEAFIQKNPAWTKVGMRAHTMPASCPCHSPHHVLHRSLSS